MSAGNLKADGGGNGWVLTAPSLWNSPWRVDEEGQAAPRAGLVNQTLKRALNSTLATPKMVLTLSV